MNTAKGKYGLIIRWVIIGIALFIGLAPFVWIILTSLKPVSEVLLSYPPTILPHNFTLKNFVTIFHKISLLKYIMNSVLVALPVTIVALIIGSFAAYAFNRMNFTLNRTIFYLVLIAMMFPGAPIMIPTFIFLKNMGLNDSLLGLSLVYLSMVLPLVIWMIYGYLKSVPKEVEEAALIDGCNRTQTVVKIVLPIIKPGLAGVAVYTFLVAWNEFTYALVLLQSESNFTISLGLVRFITDFSTFFNELSAGSILVILPVFLIYFLLGKHLIKGLAAGAVKG